ncbi:hypothetical protein FRB90_006973, partial [Tulasnella sp. 427]
MPPPSAVLSTASGSTVGPSPAKRRKLTGPSSTRSWSKATSTSSKSTLRPASSASSAATPFEDREHAEARRASVARVLSIWESLEQRYARAMDDDDIVDLRSGKLVQDRGVLKARSKPLQYGELLKGREVEDKEDGATTEGSEGLLTTGIDEEDEEDEDEGDGAEERRDPDQSLDDLQLLGEKNDGEQGVDTSEDELGEWDTVPAPPSTSPSPNASPNQSRASSPGPISLAESRPTTPRTLSTFLQANFRPKLEKLAKEREDSPLPPADDLEAFMAAEKTLKARTKPGYVEPETPSDDDEVLFLGYGTGQEYAATSDGDAREDGEQSEDELNDWDTVPAPPSDEETPTEADEPEDEPLMAHYELPAGLSDSDSEPSRTTHPSSTKRPSSSKKSSATRAKDLRPADDSSSEGSASSPTKSKGSSSSSKKPAAKTQSSTTLTPKLNRLMREPASEVRRTPSRHLVPEVVIPVYRGASSSPTKKPHIELTSPTKSPKKPSTKSATSELRPLWPTLSDSDDDAPLVAVRTPKNGPVKTKVATPKYIEITSSDEESPKRDRSARRSSGDQSPSKSGRNQNARPKSQEGPSPKTKKRGSAKKRKRESVENIQVEAQFVERMGSLGLDDSDEEPAENARQRIMASWRRALPTQRPGRQSPPPRPGSPGLDEGSEFWPEEAGYEEPPLPSHQRVDAIPQNAPQVAPPPLPQQPALPTPPPIQPSGYPGFYYPPGFPYMQMQMPLQMQVPMAMPMPMPPQFFYPPPPSPAALIATPQLPTPQPQSPQAATGNPGQEALLTQVLYTLNYLAQQNGGTLPRNQQQQPLQQPSTPPAATAVQRDSDGFAIPLPPATPQKEWR